MNENTSFVVYDSRNVTWLHTVDDVILWCLGRRNITIECHPDEECETRVAQMEAQQSVKRSFPGIGAALGSASELDSCPTTTSDRH